MKPAREFQPSAAITPNQVSFALGVIYRLVREGLPIKALEEIIQLQCHVAALPKAITGGPCWQGFRAAAFPGEGARTKPSTAPTKPVSGALNAKFSGRK